MKKIIMVVMIAYMAGFSPHAAAETAHLKKIVNSGSSSHYTLQQVMHDLAFNISRINQGIFTNNRLMIKNGADAIAAHPKPKGGIKPYIKKNRSEVMNVVPVMDKMVHQTALDMAKIAETADMNKLLEMSHKISSGCVGCHDMFRD